MKLSLLFISVLVLIAVLQSIYFYPQLPDTVASHFNGAGQANSWSSKNTFFWIYFAVVSLTVIVFLFLPSLIQRLAVAIINLLNKNHWLSEESRGYTFSFIKQQMGWFGGTTLLLEICATQLAISANFDATRSFSLHLMGILLGIYYLYVVIWLIRFLMRFRRIA